MNNKSIIIGLSGGVDSAVCAHLLLKAGYSVTGCYLCLTADSSPTCPDALAARGVADSLGIPFFTADHRESFRKNVVDYFASEYLAGRTPNPCVRCNPTVKIASLLKEADRLGAEKIATGHYARTVTEDGRVLAAASPSRKDQSYFLYGLSSAQLSRTVFPLGDFFSKDEIRLLARQLGLSSADKPDSLEICFIPDNNYTRFICEECGYVPEPGDFLDPAGNVIGQHSGIIRYTVGQRKGLGAFGAPRYVKSINAKDNTITLCTKEERLSSSLTASSIVWNDSVPYGEFRANVKIRSTASASPATVLIQDDRMYVRFDEPVIAPTPGQSAVVYDGDRVLGGGIIG